MIECLAVLGSPNPNGIGNRIIEDVRQRVIEHSMGIKLDVLKVSDTDYKLCKGCSRCFVDGQCQLTKVDNYDFYNKIMEYKLVLFLVPSYIHQMPAVFKNCFDRMAFKMHEFPFLGKKVMILSYSLSNGERELSTYFTGIMGVLGSEVVGSYSYNQCRDNYQELLQKMIEGLQNAKGKIEERKFGVTRKQEELFSYIRKIVQMEMEQNVVSHKQIRWKQLMQYTSLVECLKNAKG